MSFRSNIFGQGKNSVPPIPEGYNLHLGNVAHMIPTKTALAGELSISEIDVINFKISGNDISAYINTIYNLRNALFSHGSITHFKETGNNIGQIWSSFQFCDLLEFFYTKGTELTESVFHNSPNMKEIWIGNVTYIKPQITMFTNISPTCVIYANPFLQTSNNGGLDGNLQYAVDRGCEIRWVTSQTPAQKPQPPVIVQKFGEALEISAVVPSSSQYLEVYQNGVLRKFITATGNHYVTGLTPEELQTIELSSVGYLGERSELSQPVVTTTLSKAQGRDESVNYFISKNGLTDQAIEDELRYFVESIYDAGMWDKIFGIYPFVGSSFEEFKWNLKTPYEYNLQQMDEPLYFSNYWRPQSGSPAFRVEKLRGFQFNDFSYHFTYYSMTQSSGTVALINHRISTTSMVRMLFVGNTLYNDGYRDSGVSRQTANLGMTTGLLTIQRTTQMNQQIYHNGILKVNDSDGVVGTKPTMASVDIIGTNKDCGFVVIANGMTDAENAELYRLINRLNTLLGR